MYKLCPQINLSFLPFPPGCKFLMFLNYEKRKLKGIVRSIPKKVWAEEIDGSVVKAFTFLLDEPVFGSQN